MDPSNCCHRRRRAGTACGAPLLSPVFLTVGAGETLADASAAPQIWGKKRSCTCSRARLQGLLHSWRRIIENHRGPGGPVCTRRR